MHACYFELSRQTFAFPPTIVFRREFSFFLLSGIISKLDQVTRSGNVTHAYGYISRNFLDDSDGDYGIPPCERHESALRLAVVF